jgi:sorbitol/mannitol transport system permease protein
MTTLAKSPTKTADPTIARPAAALVKLQSNDAESSLTRQGIWMLMPALAFLAIFSFIPLAFTLFFSVLRYRLLIPGMPKFCGFQNFIHLFQDNLFLESVGHTVIIVLVVIAVSVVGGLTLASLLNNEMPGKRLIRMLMISPFFIIPAVAALIWKNLLLDPASGVIAILFKQLGLTPIDTFAVCPMAMVILIVCWQWLPFATLILLTSLQSLDTDQLEAASLDGAKSSDYLRYIILPHLSRPITIVILMELLYLLAIFAEILVTTAGGPGSATTNLTYYIYSKALLEFNVGTASAAGLLAVVLANVVNSIMAKHIKRSVGL